MKTRLIGPLLLVLFFLPFTSVFAGLSEIVLESGSVIHGEIASESGGFYTVNCKDIGTLKIEKSRVRSIGSAPPETTKQGSGEPSPQDRREMAIQQSILGNKEIMTMVFALQNDPDIQEILQDPALVQALVSGNVSTLLANPKISKLMNNPSVQEIMKRIK